MTYNVYARFNGETVVLAKRVSMVAAKAIQARHEAKAPDDMVWFDDSTVPLED